MRERRENPSKLPEKANKILNGILVVLILVVFKVWHLAILQHEKKQEEAKKPQRRVVVERCERATICDRFNVPLAINKVQYNAAISYGPIRELPRWIWKKNEGGKRVKCFFRKEYVSQLSEKIAGELHLDAERIEDLIHSKAAILGNVPCVVKENISEEQYFRLKMLEKDWPGIHAEIAARRCYPLGAIGGEVIGYIGPISREEYDKVTREMRFLREVQSSIEEGEPLESSIEEITARLEELEKKAYHINDFVGKTGVEAAYDDSLRGCSGKRIYLSDIRGKFLRELPGSEEPKSGNRLALTISSELQLYAEQLLAEYDSRPPSTRPAALKLSALIPESQPWIKGGAIVAMDPHSGEVYCLASFPRFDPNDFIRSGHEEEIALKNSAVNRWLETEVALANIWDMKTPHKRERFNLFQGGFFEEKIELDWDAYLSFILPKKSQVREVLTVKSTVADAVFVQRKVEQLVSLFESEIYPITAAKVFDFLYHEGNETTIGVMSTLQEKEFLKERYAAVKEHSLKLKEELQPYFCSLHLNYDKLLLTDLYRIVVDARHFSPSLTDLLGKMTLKEYREASARMVSVAATVRTFVQELFREHDFKQWREEHFKEYLAKKRQEEKEEKRKYARPYIEYLNQIHQELFESFWSEYKWEFITLFLTGETELVRSELNPYLQSLGQWAKELQGGAHRGLEWVHHYQRLKKIGDEFNHKVFIAFIKTLRSFSELDRPLLGKYSGLRGSKEKHLAIAFYPTYGYGFSRSHAFRQAATIGSIFKLVPAYEALRQKCLQQHRDLNPLTIVDDKHRIWGKSEGWNVGYTLDGRPIPMYYRGGRLPRSEHTGVGKVDIVRAIEASSNPYFSMLAGDILEDPEDLCKAANLLGYGEKTNIDLPSEYTGRIPIDVAYNRTGLYAMAIGQHSLVGTPLQTAVMLASFANGGDVLKPKIVKAKIDQGEVREVPSEVRWRIFLPKQIQEVLLSGLRQVVMGEKGTARVIRSEFDAALAQEIIGKTSTAEVIERMSLDGTNSRLKLKHIWFGGISYEGRDNSKPELIVVVYLRYGDWGRDAAPIAVKMVKRWREIKSQHHL